MRADPGVIASVLGHAAIIAACLVALPGGDPLNAPPIDSISVDLVSIADVTQLKQGSKTAAPSEAPKASAVETKTPEAPPVEDAGTAKTSQDTPPTPETADVAKLPDAGSPPPPAPEAAPPEPDPAPAPQETAAAPPPEPTPEDAPADEMAPPAEKAPPPVPSKMPQKKPPAPKPSKEKPVKTAQAKENQQKFNADNIAALLDKQTPYGGGTQTPTGPTALGTNKGKSTSKMTLSELDALRSQISRCWNPPVGASDGDALVVKLTMELNPDGSVVGTPEVVNSGQGPFFRAAADSARRAILRCQPYTLPAEKYDTWREVTVNFDPREMFGG
jgi:outer membrane biosynthesis protein TonB